MLEEANITFYSIKKCGYYRYAANEREFCDVSEMLSELKEWALQPGMLLGDTCTYKIEEGEEIYHTYCFDLIANNITGDFLLTTWNEMPSVEGNVASVNGGQPVGHAEVNLTELPAGGIPGYATYFWFIPSRNLFACVRFNHRLNGHGNLVKYLNEFLAKFTRFVVISDNPEIDHDIAGYRANDGQEIVSLYPQFKSLLHKKPGKIDFIINNSQKVRKITRKNKLKMNVQEQRSRVHKFLEWLGLQDHQDNPHGEIASRYEIDYTPSQDELRQIIDNWDREHNTKWDDVGFTMTGDQEIHWLSHCICKDSFKLDVHRSNAEIITGTSLLNSLTEERDRIFRIL